VAPLATFVIVIVPVAGWPSVRRSPTPCETTLPPTIFAV
jgi:hypothetical protein